MKHDSSMQGIPGKVPVLFISALLALVAAATQFPVQEDAPPLKPIDQLITAASIYRHDLAIMDLESREIAWITDDATIEQEPCWSPDGKHILYSAIDDAWHELRLLSLETGEKKTLLAEEGVSFIAPKWNVDNKLVFEKYAGRQRQMLLADITPEAIIQVEETGVAGMNPEWGPDGAVYFTGMEPTEPASSSAGPSGPGMKPKKIMIKHGDTHKKPMDIVNDDMDLPHYCAQPACSKNGKELAFRANTIGLGDIFVKTAQKMIQVTDTLYDESFPALSPNGKEVYYASDRTGAYQIYKSDQKGNEERLTENDMFDFTDLSLSPDGKKLAFKTVTMEGINPENVGEAGPPEQHPIFSGRWQTWNRTRLAPFQKRGAWRMSHQIGSFKLGKHGELIALLLGVFGQGDLVAYRIGNTIALAGLQNPLAPPYCRIVKNGSVIVHSGAISNFGLALVDIPTYPNWNEYADEINAMPEFGKILFPENTGEATDVANFEGWGFQLIGGSWYGVPGEYAPLTYGLHFIRTTSNGLDAVFAPETANEQLAFRVHPDRSVDVFDTVHFSFLTRWPYVNQHQAVWSIPPGIELSPASLQFQRPTVFNTNTGHIDESKDIWGRGIDFRAILDNATFSTPPHKIR